jgi:septum site-determining protein MinD
MKPVVVNVVSGKGGTGKTLLACVLADMLGNSPFGRTVVIDLDVFVRGLTSLLYFHQDEKLQLTSTDAVTVSDFFTTKRVSPTSSLALLRYRSFEVVPAVARIDELLDFNDLGPNTRSEAKDILSALIASLHEQYRFVILDSRAGYDELVAAAHELSTVSVCVEEQDPISRLTSDNLVSQLGATSRTPVFRLVNKARRVRSQADIITEARSVTDLGVIPFDMDILNDFGTPSFWDTVNRSLYRWALARSWNILNGKLQLGAELVLPRISPVVSERLETRLGFLGLKERILFLYGMLLALFGLLYGVFGREVVYALTSDPIRMVSLLVGIAGVAVAVYAFFRRE